jgi:hypothetical protein
MLEKKRLEFKHLSLSLFLLSYLKSYLEKAPKIITLSSSLLSLLLEENILVNLVLPINPELYKLYIPILVLGMLGTLFFNRKNITYFLKDFKSLYKEYSILDLKGILGYLLKYYSL